MKRRVVQYLQKLFGEAPTGVRTDRQLLELFAQRRDEQAFAELVRRHAGLVLDVGQRVLHHVDDAEDVFQATFLVLARKASSIPWRDSVAGWLYQVAYRLALKARAQARKREAKEGLAAQPQAVPEIDPSWRELCAVLDEELQQMPSNYRAPLLLCCLEGRSRDEAARQLGWSLGQVKGRLERGRVALRERLLRRGITLSIALLSARLTTETAQAGDALVTAISRAALGYAATGTATGVSAQAILLAEGVLRAMMLTKIQMALTGVLAVVLLGIGGGLVAFQAREGLGNEPVQVQNVKQPTQKELQEQAEQLKKELAVVRAKLEEAERKYHVLAKQHQDLSVVHANAQSELKTSRESQRKGALNSTDQGPAKLGPTERAISLKFAAPQDIRPLDRVDVMVIAPNGVEFGGTNARGEQLLRGPATLVARNLTVVAVGATANVPREQLVSLKVTVDEAEKLAVAEFSGQIRLLVRGRPGDLSLAEGLRGMSVSLGATDAGLFQPGDRLDVLALDNEARPDRPQAKIVLENLSVLRVNPTMLTLIVTEPQAEILAIKSHRGPLRFLKRGR